MVNLAELLFLDTVRVMAITPEIAMVPAKYVIFAIPFGSSNSKMQQL